MTKAELVEKVANQINLTKKQTEVVVNTVFSSITDSLAEGKKVELRGFGSFRIRQRNARIGRNPKSGQKVDVPSKKVPFFKAGKELRELVDEQGAMILADHVELNDVDAGLLATEVRAKWGVN